MFKGLTQRAQMILTMLAQEEAKRFHSKKLQPEHILLAVLKDGSGMGYKVLSRTGIDPGQLQIEIEKSFKKERRGLIIGDLFPSERTRKMLEKASDEARYFNHDYIGTEHLIIAMAENSNGVTSKFFKERNITADMIRAIVLDLRTPKTIKRESFFNSKAAQLKRSGNNTNTPILSRYAIDFTEEAKRKKLDPIIGRESEIKRLIQILARRNKNNPILLGEPGVGKTAIVEGLAQIIVEGYVPDVIAEKRVLSLDLAALLAGTKFRGEFEDRIKRLVSEIKSSKNVILFIDELHTIIGAGGGDGALDASNMLKPALSRGEFQCIGATTFNEYKKYIEKDAALERRFQSIVVEEPNIENSIEILNGVKENYEKYHNVKYVENAIEIAVKLSSKYIPDRFLPDKAIDLIDEAGSYKRINSDLRPANVIEIEKEIERLNKEKISYVNNQNYEKAASVRDIVREKQARLKLIKKSWSESNKNAKNEVDSDDIQELVSKITGIPLSRIAQSESEKLLKIEEELHKTVIGQSDGIKVIASAIRRSRTGLSSNTRPMGSFIFIGPTGVGKTLLAKTLAEFLFGDKDSLIRIDMSDYMEKHNLSRLVGAPPGYVGYEEGGALTEQIRRRPYSVILFDEIEKAHHDVFNLLLQILEEGELTDNLGHRVSFRNTVLIMTSNAGAREISHDSTVGFSTTEEMMSHKEIKSSAMNELKRVFRPEFLNRIDDIIVFHSLTKENVSKIFDIMMNEVALKLFENNIYLEISKNAKDLLISESWNPKFGARPLRRIIQTKIEDGLSLEILRGKFKNGDHVLVECRKNEIKFRLKKGVASEK